MSEYVKEQIYNNIITAKDVVEDRTGINYWDSLDPERRNQLLKELSKMRQSMTLDPAASFILDFDAMIRQKNVQITGS